MKTVRTLRTNNKRNAQLRVVLPAAVLAFTAGCASSPMTASPVGSSSSTSEALLIEEIETGEGEPVESGDKIAVHYEGRFPDGTVFDASKPPEPFKFILGAGLVIEGWDQGLLGMQEGGVRKLVIPPHLAYGASGGGPIPPNTTLTFEVELIQVISRQ